MPKEGKKKKENRREEEELIDRTSVQLDENFDANFDNPGLPSDEEAVRKNT